MFHVKWFFAVILKIEWPILALQACRLCIYESSGTARLIQSLVCIRGYKSLDSREETNPQRLIRLS